jgi:ABC-type multidrug transport system fused ATPase/permease subunit
LADEGRSSLQPVLLLSGLVVLSGLLAGVELWMLDRVAERIAMGARLGLASRMLRLRLSELDRRPLGDLLSRVTSDTTLLRAATTTGVVESFNGGLALLGAIVLMGLLDGLLLLVTVGGSPRRRGGRGSRRPPRIARAMERAQAAVGTVGNALQRALGATRTVKASGAEERELAVVTAAATEAHDQGVAVARYTALSACHPASPCSSRFSQCLGWAARELLRLARCRHADRLPAPPVLSDRADRGPGDGSNSIAGGARRVSRIDEVAALDVEQDRPAITAPGDLDGRPIVAFDRVSFAYRPDEPVLREVSFSVPPASQTAIVGPSGAKKTTLVALLERFYDPSGGTITLSETPLHRIPRAVLRARIGYVEQDAPVLAGTLRENLLYALPGASEQALAAVIVEARLAETLARSVLVIAHRLSTVVAADQIVVLDRGRVRAIGSHAELIEGDSLYRELRPRS